MKTESVWCLDCDHEHECEVVSEEFEEYVDIPDDCESCGASMTDCTGPIRREDFHSDV